MAGIKVPQYEIFKIGTQELKYNKWDLHISKNEALKFNELIALFEAQEFRMIAQILDCPIQDVDFSNYIMSVVIDKKSHFKRAVSRKGIKLNGNTFRRFVGTTGGLKCNTLLFVNVEVLDRLNEMCECNRDKTIPLVPAKYEAYKALTCSASQPIPDPEHILVVSDCITHYKDTVIMLDNTDMDSEQPKMWTEENMDLENNATDGFNLCTIDYMKCVSEELGIDYVTSGVCLRNAWLKGMMYPFPIVEFFDRYRPGDYIVKDIWGNEHDIRTVDMILTESSLKLWYCYDSIDDYVAAYKKNGYGFAITKMSPEVLDDQRELNYQYLQSYEFDDKDIEELCAPTVKYLRDSFCGDYESTKKFLGITGNEDRYSWQRALGISEYMLGDPYVIDSVHRLIKKKISDAKIGKLIVDGNYQIASGDPFIMMQHIAGLEETGLLKAEECYSQYWSDKDVDDVVVLRSPMTSHNNIRRCKVATNEEMRYWYQYMGTIMIINAWDSFCMATNGSDFDGDLLYSSNNPVLLRRHRKLPAINCVQQSAEKVVVTEEAVLKSNLGGMGNDVGTITNRVTSMIETQSHFEKGTREWEELEYRITCGQTFQQDEIDKIKGIKAKSMPSCWYHYGACKGDKFLQSVCTDKRPYFMNYAREDYKAKYNKFIKANRNRCRQTFNVDIENLIIDYNDGIAIPEEQVLFVEWYQRKMPSGVGNCAMNNICYYIENQFNGYKSSIKSSNTFDYHLLKTGHRCTNMHRNQIFALLTDYIEQTRLYKADKLKNERASKIVGAYSVEGVASQCDLIERFYRNEAKKLCTNDDELFDIVLDMCYGNNNNKNFCWNIVGDKMCEQLEVMKYWEDNIETNNNESA